MRVPYTWTSTGKVGQGALVLAKASHGSWMEPALEWGTACMPHMRRSAGCNGCMYVCVGKGVRPALSSQPSPHPPTHMKPFRTPSQVKALAARCGLRASVLGGGRMEHDPAARTLSIYGYSSGFGPAPHEVAAAIAHRWLPLYDREAITVSYKGY